MLRAELIKLKRSSTWVLAVILPLLAVVTGTLNFTGNPEVVDRTWSAFASQVTLFYGLLFFSMGVSLMASTVWRTEHRGSNWNLLLTGTRRPVALVLAKIAAICMPVTLMQVVLVLGTSVSGMLFLDLEGSFPWELVSVGVLAVVTSVALASAQSLLSLVMRSFAAPVAICLLGCVLGVASVTSTALRPLSYVLPQAISTRTLNLGPTAVDGSGGLSLGDVLPLVGASLTMTTLFVLLTLGGIRKIVRR